MKGIDGCFVPANRLLNAKMFRFANLSWTFPTIIGSYNKWYDGQPQNASIADFVESFVGTNMCLAINSQRNLLLSRLHCRHFPFLVKTGTERAIHSITISADRNLLLKHFRVSENPKWASNPIHRFKSSDSICGYSIFRPNSDLLNISCYMICLFSIAKTDARPLNDASNASDRISLWSWCVPNGKFIRNRHGIVKSMQALNLPTNGIYNVKPSDYDAIRLDGNSKHSKK